MKKKLVSVIIPYFNKKKFFKKTISSILNQSFKNLEIIIIYDDLNHQDLKFVKSIVLFDKRIKLLINHKNLGAGYSRNRGINIAKGDFLAFIDADDLWNKRKIEYQLNFMLKNKLSCSHTSYKIIDENNKLINYRIAKNFLNYESLLKSCDIGLSTVMLKKNVFSGGCKFPNIATKEDFVLWLKILKKNQKFVGIPKIFVSWRKSQNSLSSSIFQKIKDGFRVYNYYMKFNFLKSIYYLIILSFNYLKKK